MAVDANLKFCFKSRATPFFSLHRNRFSLYDKDLVLSVGRKVRLNNYVWYLVGWNEMNIDLFYVILI
jgi:hypothetical protein